MNFLLHRIIEDQDINTWARLKPQFFEPPYNKIYNIIDKFYESKGKIPSFKELEIVIKDEASSKLIKALEILEVPDEVETEFLLHQLVDEYSQRIAIDKLEDFITDLSFKETTEIVEDLAAIPLYIEEQTEISEHISTMDKFMTIDLEEIGERIPLGINNDFDQHSIGMAAGEMFMIGGYRGTGKSVICSNVLCNQLTQGNSSLYFSIEMSAREVYIRNLAILSGVSAHKIKSGKLTFEEQIKIAQARAKMTEDGAEDLLKEFYKEKDFFKFESELIKRPLSKKAQIITVDDSNLTVPEIDATISTFKKKFQDNLKIVVVDYINQISEKSFFKNQDAYDWKVQMSIAKKLKALARKHDVRLVTPYQTHESGQARLSKGLLDATDWAFSLKAYKKGRDAEDVDAIHFHCEKSRNDTEMDFTSAIDWDTLQIFSNESPVIETPTMKGAKKKAEPREVPAKEKDDL